VISERPSVCMASSLSSGSAGGCGLEKLHFVITVLPESQALFEGIEYADPWPL
jgi:hypothetical protein